MLIEILALPNVVLMSSAECRFKVKYKTRIEGSRKTVKLKHKYTPSSSAIVFELLNKAKVHNGLALFRLSDTLFMLTWSNGKPPISILELNTLKSQCTNRPFQGGYVGWLGFEAGFHFEGVETKRQLPNEPLDLFWECDGAIHIDTKHQKLTVYGQMNFKEEAAKIISSKSVSTTKLEKTSKSISSPNQSKDHFLTAVEQVQSDIREGHVYQVNVSWSLEHHIPNPTLVFEKLFLSNPARYTSFLQYDNHGVISNSPELFLSVKPAEDGAQITSIPIKGTANQTDLKSRKNLWESPKERAELSMIVDMVRNDLSRVAQVGTVKVHHRRIRRCGDLLHAEQKVSAKLKEGCGIPELFAATFPPASVTGAPKVSAIKRIHRLEKNSRGIYTGCIGYVGHDGQAQFSVAIRCLPFTDQTARLHIGSGIVFDSSPPLEWLETLAKARAIRNILTPTSQIK
ncbi:MAG: chorismate-binding protein [Myxococcota bacterium]